MVLRTSLPKGGLIRLLISNYKVMLDLKQVIKDANGEDVFQYMEETKKMEPQLLGAVLEAVILKAPCPNDDCKLEYKLSRYDLFKKIKDQDSIELTEEEKTMIIELTNAQYDVFFTGQINELLK